MQVSRIKQLIRKPILPHTSKPLRLTLQLTRQPIHINRLNPHYHQPIRRRRIQQENPILIKAHQFLNIIFEFELILQGELHWPHIEYLKELDRAVTLRAQHQSALREIFHIFGQVGQAPGEVDIFDIFDWIFSVWEFLDEFDLFGFDVEQGERRFVLAVQYEDERLDWRKRNVFDVLDLFLILIEKEDFFYVWLAVVEDDAYLCLRPEDEEGGSFLDLGVVLFEGEGEIA